MLIGAYVLRAAKERSMTSVPTCCALLAVFAQGRRRPVHGERCNLCSGSCPRLAILKQRLGCHNEPQFANKNADSRINLTRDSRRICVF